MSSMNRDTDYANMAQAIRRHPPVAQGPVHLYAEAVYGAARQYHRSGFLKRTLAYYVLAIGTSPLYLRTYPALILFLLDSLLGQKRRKRAVNILWPGSWPAGWTIS